MSPDDQAPKIHIDSDWKAEAQAEKERLTEEEKKQADAKSPAGGGPHQMPEANFRTLVSVLASQALMGLGAVQDPEGKGVMIDLDGFKHFNDTYGHSAGDQIIRETGRLFRQHCRQHDIVSRYSGDEFAVVFWDAEEPRVSGSQHPTSPLTVLRRFKKSLETHAFPKLGAEARGCITVSGGLATYPWDAKDAQGLIDKADQAMLQAKRDGKNRIYLLGAEGQPMEEAGPTSI